MWQFEINITTILCCLVSWIGISFILWNLKKFICYNSFFYLFFNYAAVFSVFKVCRMAAKFSTVDLKLHLPNENIRLAAHYTMFTSAGALFYFVLASQRFSISVLSEEEKIWLRPSPEAARGCLFACFNLYVPILMPARYLVTLRLIVYSFI